MDANKRIGQKIQELRKLNNITQASLAQHLSLPRSSISQIETGDRVLSAIELFQLSNLLNVTLGTFFDLYQDDSRLTKFKKILCLNYDGKELKEQYWTRIYNLTQEIVLTTSDNPNLNELLKDADCLLVKLGAKVDKAMIDKAPNLKYIGMFGTGYGGIDIKCAARKNIMVCNVADYATEGVAEIIFGMIFNHIRDLGRGLKQAQKGLYSEAGYKGTEIKGKTFGIIGLGNIGSRTAEIAKVFGANVQYWSRNRKEKYEEMGIVYKELDEILTTSDFISINLSLNPGTEKFFNEDRINKIKKDSIIINLSPMELIDIKALSQRLKKKDITFMLDHADEMSLEDVNLIKDYPNCIIQLPIGYTTDESFTVKQGSFVKSLEDYISGKESNKVN